MALRRKTEENFSKLVKCIDPSNELLAGLWSVIFVRDRIPLMKQHHRTVDDKVDALLTTLMETPDGLQEEVMKGFVAALRSSGQDHVANIFRRESEKVPMSDEHHELLSRKRDTISNFLDPRDELMDILVRDGVFSETNRSLVHSNTTVEEMARQTVDILIRKPDCNFDKFINATNEAGQSHVSYIIVGVGKPPLSYEYRGILHRKMKDLCKYIDTDNGLLDSLCSAEVLTVLDTKRVRSKTGFNAMTRELVEIIRRKSDEAFDALIDALNETGQSHVSFILTGQGDSRPLDEEFRKKLTENRSYLVKTIDAKYSGLITELMSKGVFSDYDQQRVTGIETYTNNDRAEVMLDLMARKSQTSFDKFIVALKDTGQEHVAVEFVGVELVATILARIRRGAYVTEDNVRQRIQDALEQDRPEVRRLNEVLSNNGISVHGVANGSILITFGCRNGTSLHNLKSLQKSRELDRLLTETFCVRLRNHDVLALAVDINQTEYWRCKKTFSELKMMTSEHRQALESSAEWLVENMAVTDDLLEKLSLCERRRQAIERAGTREEQVKTLLDILSRRPDSAFEQLVNALDANSQRPIAEFIRKSVPPQTRSRNISRSPLKVFRPRSGVLSSRENRNDEEWRELKRKIASVRVTHSCMGSFVHHSRQESSETLSESLSDRYTGPERLLYDSDSDLEPQCDALILIGQSEIERQRQREQEREIERLIESHRVKVREIEIRLYERYSQIESHRVIEREREILRQYERDSHYRRERLQRERFDEIADIWRSRHVPEPPVRSNAPERLSYDNDSDLVQQLDPLVSRRELPSHLTEISDIVGDEHLPQPRELSFTARVARFVSTIIQRLKLPSFAWFEAHQPDPSPPSLPLSSSDVTESGIIDEGTEAEVSCAGEELVSDLQGLSLGLDDNDKSDKTAP